MNKLSLDFNIPFFVSAFIILLIGGIIECVADVTENNAIHWAGVTAFALLGILYGRNGGAKSIFFSVICFIFLIRFCHLAIT